MPHATTLDIGGTVTGNPLDSNLEVQIHMDDQGVSAPYITNSAGDVIFTHAGSLGWVPVEPNSIINPSAHPRRQRTGQEFINQNSTTFNNAVITQINEYDADIQEKYEDLNTFPAYTTAQQTTATIDPNQSNPTQPGAEDQEDKPGDYKTYEGVKPITDYDGTGDPWAVRDGTTIKDLRYPLKHTDLYDFIQIFPMKYTPSIQGAGTNELAFDASKSFSMVNDRYYTQEKAGSTIFLPMIPASETTSTGWGGEEINAIQKEFGIAASKMIGSAGPDGAPSIQEWVKGAGGSLMEATNRLLKGNEGLHQYITAYFAGKAVSANILGRSGVAINPNLELLFSGPGLRSFSYNFRFTPREELEAQEIRDIIKVFKKGMAPRRTEGHMFLNVPNVWSIKYIHNSQNKNTEVHPYLNKIKTCALKSFNVNYMPDGSYMTYAGSGVGKGSMTSYQVSMEFGELEPIYNNDIDMTKDDMGY